MYISKPVCFFFFWVQIYLYCIYLYIYTHKYIYIYTYCIIYMFLYIRVLNCFVHLFCRVMRWIFYIQNVVAIGRTFLKSKTFTFFCSHVCAELNDTYGPTNIVTYLLLYWITPRHNCQKYIKKQMKRVWDRNCRWPTPFPLPFSVWEIHVLGFCLVKLALPIAM